MWTFRSIRRRAARSCADRLSQLGRRSRVEGTRVASNGMATQFAYLVVLGVVLAGCLWLELALRTRVLARPRRLLLTIAPVVVVFFLWDAYAIGRGHWSFDTQRILGIYAPWSVPLDEIGF